MEERRKRENFRSPSAAVREERVHRRTPCGDPSSDAAKLKVKFYVPPFLPIIPVVGDYWVLYLDGDYHHALIGQPTRNYLWILCRENHLDEEIYNQVVEKAKEEGYDVSKLRKTQHTNPPPEGEEGPKDTKGVWWIKSMLEK
ncbi:Temperature-induced lipocalin-1 [Camellia lanceoleosa]|uniref:Temperature-induced lipocalin-1 n=1 Tax=Camellia lanceoleosa TaxID=1840588 RepID=A0ACC0GBT8_9ERIC|nr:Temperature-induced lipocalin-1 [Camellia lanceoleosa]